MQHQMGWKQWQENDKKFLNSATTFRELFQVLTTTLLSLLPPLSFLLLARLTTARYLLDFDFNISSNLFSIFLYTNPTPIHGLVCIVIVATLVHGLSNGQIVMPSIKSTEPIEHLHICAAWIILCTLQVLVVLGIDGSLRLGVEGSNYGYQISLFSKVVFFLGLHEMMLHWWRTIVKPVVDDTVYGYKREERWVERVFMAASLSVLWWWRLKDEVETPVVVAVLSGGSVEDFLGWWLYYLTVTIGMVRVVKVVGRFGMILLSRKVEQNDSDSCKNDEKV